MNEWLGRAGAVAQVATLTVTGAGTGAGVAGVNVGPKPVRAATANTMTAAAFAANLYAALNASAEPEVADCTYSYTAGGTVITATGRTPGQPVTFTGAGANGLVVTPVVTVAATGPNSAANPVNWSAGVLPDNTAPGLVRSGPDILYDLDTGLVSSTAFEVRAEWTGKVGLPDRNGTGQATYSEYRPKRAKFAAGAVLTIGTGGNGTGPSRFRAEFAGNGAKVTVLTTAAPDVGEVGAVDVSTTANLAELHVLGGTVQFNRDAQGGSAGAVHVTGGRLSIQNNASITSLKVDNGRADVNANMAAVPVTMTGGEIHVTGGSQSAWNLTGGTLYAEFSQAADSPVTVTAEGPGGNTRPPAVDCRPCPGSFRIAAGSTFLSGAMLIDPYGNSDSDGSVHFDPASINNSQLGTLVKVDRT